jgi:hypothetical protein
LTIVEDPLFAIQGPGIDLVEKQWIPHAKDPRLLKLLCIFMPILEWLYLLQRECVEKQIY